MSAADKARRTDSLLVKQRGRCRWCGCKVVRVGALDQSTIVMVRHRFVVWRQPDGSTTQAMIASLDHVVPTSRGGPDALFNLVACKPCNEERGAPELPPVVQPVAMAIDAERSKVIFW